MNFCIIYHAKLIFLNNILLFLPFPSKYEFHIYEGAFGVHIKSILAVHKSIHVRSFFIKQNGK